MNRPLEDWQPAAHGLNAVATGMLRLATVIRDIRRGDARVSAELAPRVLSRAALAHYGDEATAASIINAATRSDEHQEDLKIDRERREESRRKPSRAEATRNWEATIGSLPDLLNRAAQANSAAVALHQALEANRSAPFALVAEGVEEQAPEALIRRLKSDILPRELPALASMGEIPIYRVPWPQSARGANAFEIFRPGLARVLSRPANAGREQLEAELSRERGFTVVHTTIDAVDWKPDSARLLHAWLELWDGWRRTDNARCLIVALLVRYASPNQPRQGQDLALESALNDTLNDVFPGVYLHRVEQPLGPVRRTHIDDWLGEPAVLNLPRSLRSRISQWARELFKAQPEISMEDAIDFLTGLFDEHRTWPEAG